VKPPRYTDDPARFANVDLRHTDLTATFARVRREQRLRQQAEQQGEPVAPVINILRRAK
jgi:hypothetical protein